MNYRELMFQLGAVSGTLRAPMFDALAKDGKITKGEIDSTRERLKDIVSSLHSTPANKIEAMLEQYGAQLTQHFQRFESQFTVNFLTAFQEAQLMLGFMTTILAKSGIKEA